MPETIKVYKTKFQVRSKLGRLLEPEYVKIAILDDRLEFLVSPFSCKDEIKAMRGATWHGFDEDNPRKIWSVDNCQRNWFQIQFLEGKNPYAWFERPVEELTFTRPLKLHQKENVQLCLTYHYQVIGDEMGLGKTLTAIEVMERSGVKHWWYVSRKKPCEAVKEQAVIWGMDPSIRIELMTFDAFVERVRTMDPTSDVPQGLIVDEASACKDEDTQRSQSAQWVADRIRAKYGYKGFVIEMSGTPSPKKPSNWWKLCEIAFPGFVREGSQKAFEQRLVFLEKKEYATGTHNEIVGWRDNECKCDKCGRCQYCKDRDDAGKCKVCGSLRGCHPVKGDDDYKHDWEASKNEVGYLYERLKGLVVRHFKKDCLDLPEKQYRIIRAKPHPSTLRVATALVNSSMNGMQGATLLRELSDGFQYQQKVVGKTDCNCCKGKGTIVVYRDPENEHREFQSIDMLDPEYTKTLDCVDKVCPQCDGTKLMDKIVRTAREIPCPKEQLLIDQLEENDEVGRILVFAGFTASIDRCVRLCLDQGWDVWHCDGGHYQIVRKKPDGQIEKLTGDPLAYWRDTEAHRRVAFVAHPESGGQGLTLTEASTAVFWSNSYKPEYRIQAEDRIHRMGMDENRGATIVDLIHLPSDEKVLNVIRENRRLELMTLGDIMSETDWNEDQQATSTAA